MGFNTKLPPTSNQMNKKGKCMNWIYDIEFDMSNSKHSIVIQAHRHLQRFIKNIINKIDQFHNSTFSLIKWRLSAREWYPRFCGIRLREGSMQATYFSSQVAKLNMRIWVCREFSSVNRNIILFYIWKNRCLKFKRSTCSKC
jgi:hypothetical protein